MGIELTVSGLSKGFGGRPALEDVSCVFPAGKICAVIGPNGSGKSTLLRIIGCLEQPSSGGVGYSSEGSALKPGITLMRRMTLSAQRPVLFNASLASNIAYGLKARGLPDQEVRSRVNDAIEAGGLSGLASVRATTLSGGQAQKAALARAYALRPEAVFLDEPTANLDPDGTALAERLITKMSREHGATVVMVTHNLFQARRMADFVYFMYGGALVESGTAECFFGTPASELSRRYVTGELVC